MKLVISTPKGTNKPIECDSVHLTIHDDCKGKNGGSYGIRKGHVKALIALEKGKTIALKDNKEIFSAETDTGFATVENDVITMVIDNYKEI